MNDVGAPTDDRGDTEELPPPAAGRALVRQFRLRGHASDPRVVFTSTEPRVVIGTHRSATVCLADPSVSRFHCEIAMEDGVAVVRDLGSRNGTHVDDVPVRIAPLRDRATLIVGRTRLEFEMAASYAEVPLSDRDRFGGLVGGSSAMRATYALLERAAASDANALILGETGTGKELAARAIHDHSRRAGGPFVALDTGAIPAGLLESELFGHERGAFTDAAQRRRGCFELADGGSLFLDEIGELSLDLQAKLLRVLETRELRRVGASDVVRVDVRVIAATHRSLEREVFAGRFRADLYYRLAVLPVTMPPLRARRGDLAQLVDELLRRAGEVDGPAAASIRDPAFVARLASHSWPGNVRELRNLVERSLALAAPVEPPGGAWHDAPTLDFDQSLATNREVFVRYVERAYVAEFLRRHDDNVSAAARACGMDRAHFHRLAVRAGLRPDGTR